MSGSLLQLKLFKGLPGVGTFFFGFGAAGGKGAWGAGGGAGAGGAGGAAGGGGMSDGGGGGGGTLHVSITALFRLLTYKDELFIMACTCNAIYNRISNNMCSN